MKLYELNTKNNQQFCLLKGSMELRKENVRRIEDFSNYYYGMLVFDLFKYEYCFNVRGSVENNLNKYICHILTIYTFR